MYIKAGEMAQSVKCMPFEQEDLSWGTLKPPKMWVQQCVHYFRAGKAETRRSLRFIDHQVQSKQEALDSVINLIQKRKEKE